MVFLLHAAQINAVGQLLDQLIEHVDRQISIGLEVFHRDLPRAQRRDFSLQGSNVFDFGFKLGDFRLQEAVALLLVGNLALVPGEHRSADHAAEQSRQAKLGEKLLFLFFACGLSVRQQVDQNHW